MWPFAQRSVPNITYVPKEQPEESLLDHDVRRVVLRFFFDEKQPGVCDWDYTISFCGKTLDVDETKDSYESYNGPDKAKSYIYEMHQKGYFKHFPKKDNKDIKTIIPWHRLVKIDYKEEPWIVKTKYPVKKPK
jgi:hypothetical protein